MKLIRLAIFLFILLAVYYFLLHYGPPAVSRFLLAHQPGFLKGL